MSPASSVKVVGPAVLFESASCVIHTAEKHQRIVHRRKLVQGMVRAGPS